MRRLVLVVAGLALALSGCATLMPERPRAAPAAIDVSGRWVGTWYGHGVAGIAREEEAMAEFQQRGAMGRGLFTLDGALAADAVPITVRAAGLSGSRVLIEVEGANLMVVHELGPRHLKAKFKVDGDRMVGHILETDTPVRIVLEREKPQPPKLAAAPPRMPPPPPVAAPPSAPGGPTTAEPLSTTHPPLASTTPGAEPTSEMKSPEGMRPAVQDFAEVPDLKVVHFDFDRATIRPEDLAILDENAEWLKGNQVLVLIEGHADERGTNEYNLALGERRAKAVRDHLVNKGVTADRINTVSYGEERPSCMDKGEACWKQNRRANSLVKPQ
jgi:peptidoglycan-associated lipoprotein